jgi:hypothetical protein
MCRLRRKLCLLLSIWVLNLSVDAPDLLERLQGAMVQPLRGEVGLNEIESIVEWLVEHMLGLNDAVPEGGEATDAPDDHRAFEPVPLAVRLCLRTRLTKAAARPGPAAAQPQGRPQALEPPPPRG